MALTADQIYQNFHQHASGTAGLSAAQDYARQLADRYADHVSTAQQTIDGVRDAWQGTAGDAAVHGLMPFAEGALTHHDQLGQGQDLTSRQIDSFHTAAAEVQPVPPAPGLTDVIGAAMHGHTVVPILEQMNQSHAAQQANVDAYTKYVAASRFNTDNLPAMQPIEVPSSAVSVRAAPSSAVTSGIQAATGTLHAARRTPGAPTPRTTPTHDITRIPARIGRDSVVTATKTAPNDSGATTVSATQPAGSALPPASTPPSTGTIGQASQPGGTSVGIELPDDGSLAIARSASTSASATAGASTSAITEAEPEIEPGTVNVIDDGQPRFDSGTPFAEIDRPVNGRIPGRAPQSPARASQPFDIGGETSPRAAETAAVQGGSAAEEPMPAMPMSRSAGDQDTTRKSRYILDEDGDLRFGPSEEERKVAPPVIGELRRERERRHREEAERHRSFDV